MLAPMEGRVEIITEEALIGTEWMDYKLSLKVVDSLDELLIALTLDRERSAADGTRCCAVGVREVGVAGVLVVVLHLLDQDFEVLQVVQVVEGMVGRHGCCTAGDVAHLCLVERAVEDEEVVEEGVLHDGIG